jgi:hypothetical protein
MEQMYSLPTIARMWDMSVRHLRRLLKEAGIEIHMIGRSLKVKESDLLMLIISSEEINEIDSLL